MAQSSNQAERLAEYNKILLDVRDFFKDVLIKEPISDTVKGKCNEYVDKLDAFIKPPSLPPRKSGKISTTIAADADNLITSDRKISSENGTKDTNDLASQEFLEEQRNLSRKGTMWTNAGEKSATLPYQSKKKKSADRSTFESYITPPIKKSQPNGKDHDAIYERIGSVSKQANEVIDEDTADSPQSPDEPPPVPQRKGRAPTIYDKTLLLTPDTLEKDGILEPVMVHDLKNPLYSGLLRNVQTNTKQWCVVKRQRLYLFHDLQNPSDFIIDLREYEVFKDSEDKYTFHVRHEEKPSIILAAVDDEQYELWHNAFRRAQNEAELSEYVSLKGSEEIDDDEDEDPSYETPDVMLERMGVISPTIYVSMENLVSPSRSSQSSFSPRDYETMDFPLPAPPDGENAESQINNHSYYSSMPLPPIPDNDDVPPELPERRRILDHKSDDDSSTDSDSYLSGSFASLDGIDLVKEQNKTNTWPRKKIVGRKQKEVEFMRDLSAVYCGILHQRRMLAVWQKRFCKVKDQWLLCYRQADSAEPCLRLELSGYQLDRAEETWKTYSFKIFKDSSDIFYFAAETRNDLIKWLSVLAKEIDKEKFKPTDISDKGPTNIQEEEEEEEEQSTEDSSTSIENIPSVEIEIETTSRTSSIDADADSEKSLESEDIEKKPEKIPKHRLLRVGKREKSRGRSRSFEDPNADLQGYLYRKLKNHWSKRWCCVKDKKFLSYRNTPNDPPNIAILLTFASLTIPPEEENRSGYHMFKLRFEGENSAIFSAKKKESWKQWTDCIEKYVGSKSEESFPYVNVPPLSSDKNKEFFPSDEKEAHLHSFQPDMVSSPMEQGNKKLLTSKYQLPVPPRAPSMQRPNFDILPKSDTELKDARYSGFLTELQLFNHSFRHLERFIVLTKDKLLKFYEDVTSTVPVAVFYAMNIQVIDERGADAVILRLHIEETDKEILLKASDEKVAAAWKNIFDKIHYEEIDDGITDEDDHLNNVLSSDDTTGERMFRKRSKSIEKKDKTEPVLLSHSKTMPNVGKMKKRAKELKEEKEREKEKSKTLPVQASGDTPTRERKGLSSLIRSFTVDTLTRKAKNKSYELSAPREDDILLKETQKGILKQVIIENDKEIFEDRLCRISGKIFYCYMNDKDKKPLFKIPLKNSAIEEITDASAESFRFQITAMDTGFEYMFSLTSETELDNWIAALYGDDQLHKSLDSSPFASTHTLGSDTKSPKTQNRTPLVKTLSGSSVESSLSLASPSISSVADILSTERNSVTPDSTTKEYFFDSDKAAPSQDIALDSDESKPETKHKRSSTSDSTSSRLTLNENESKLVPLLEEKIKLNHLMFEMTNSGELSKTKSKRWVVLRKTVVEIYNNEKDRNPIKILPLNDFTLSDIDNSKKRIIQLQTSNAITIQLTAPSDEAYKVWMTELKRIKKDLRRTSRDRSRSIGNIVFKKNATDRLRDLKSTKDKRASMVLVADDIRAIEQHEESADPSNNISGPLLECFDDGKEKERHCWIKNGSFYLAKRLKPDKPIKTINLSTVVILDESDPASNKYAFKLDHSTDIKTRIVFLRTSSQILADKWMVAISMGILFHRLSGSQSRSSQSRESYLDQESMEPKDFEFVTLNDGDFEESRNSQSRRLSSDNKLGHDIKREIARKAENGGEHLVPVSELLKDEFPTPDGSPKESKKFKVPKLEIKKATIDATDGEESNVNDKKVIRRFSDLKDEEDQVFSLQPIELLENIPERENADETFKNVKGILRQQESIRRGILHRQRSNASVKRNSTHTNSVARNASDVSKRSENEETKKIPPKTKPKPKMRKTSSFLSYFLFDNFMTLKDTLENLDLADLQNYKAELENEKTSLIKSIKNMSTVVSDAKLQLKNERSNSITSEGSVSEIEYKTVTNDLETMQNRMQIIDKEIKKVHSSINRNVAASMGKKQNKRTSSAIWYQTNSSSSQPNSPVVQKKSISSIHEDGYKSEPLLDDILERKRIRSYSIDSDSIII